MFGITDEGFVTKRLEDIKIEIEDSLRNSLGNNINLLPQGVLGQIVGIFSERESLLWELMEAVYNSQYPDTASGATLDLVASITGITRLSASESIVVLKLYGDVGTVIPSGSEISRADNSNVVFETISSSVISSGIDEVKKITFSIIPDAGQFKLTFNGNETGALLFNATSVDVQSALNNLPDLSSVLVTGDFSTGFDITFTGTDGQKPQSDLTISENTLVLVVAPVAVVSSTSIDGAIPSSTVAAKAKEVGPIEAPSGTLSVIETPVTGWDSVENELDADLGRDEESDAELKIRRDLALQQAGAATVGAIFSQLSSLDGVSTVRIFENITEIYDLEGRPPKSYEAVIQGGDEDEIAATIWSTKPAGIQTFGDILKNILDSQGYPQQVSFSRPTGLTIYVTLNITAGLDFPANGASLASDAIVDYGKTFEVGQDVITIPKLLCTVANIDGILDIEVLVGTSASPTLSDNIIVADNEIAEFDSSRILVNLV
jgi:uncharacterized phage protein gp47/JayE